MDRREFDTLEIEKQLDYINNKLQKGYTLTKACKEINVGRSTIRDRAKKIGQAYDNSLNKYIAADSIKSDISKTISIKEIETEPEAYKYNSHTNVLNGKKLNNLIDRYDEIIKMIDWFENDKNETIVSKGIKINLPEEINKNYRKTIRINDTVWNKFSIFCNSHKEFKERDLLSQALLEYMSNHK